MLSEAWLLATLDDWEGAFEVLEAAEREATPLLALTGLPGFDPLRTDPRLTSLLERLELTPTGAS